MAKKNEGGKPTDASASEEILDALAEDVGAEYEAGADDASDAEPVVPEKKAAKSSKSAKKTKSKAAEPPRGERHRRGTEETVTEMLMGAGAEKDVDLADLGDGKARTGLNLFLVLALLGTGGFGFWKFSQVSSKEAMDAKRQARIDAEAAHLAEQLAKQKKWGTLRIESNPPQAAVIRDGKKMMVEAVDAEGAKTEKEVLTPVNINNLDIAVPLKFRIEMTGYEPYEFAVAEHLWTKDAATGEYKFFKMVELQASACEYWYLYDSKKKRELQFFEKEECGTHYDEATAAKISVTECTCKQPPEGTDIQEFLKKQEEERAKRAKKKGKKGK